MSRHIACLTFDFDTFSAFLARGMSTPTPVSRGEFGVVGARRLLALMRDRGIRTTWYTPGFTIETYPDVAAEIVAAGHEIAHHGWTHLPPATWNGRDEEEADLTRGVETIRALTGRPPRGYRSPSWDLSPHTVDLLLAHGFDYDSSMMGDDYTPYFARRGDVITVREPAVFGETTRLLELPISWSLDDFPLFEYLRHQGGIQQATLPTDAILCNWVEDFEYMAQSMDWGIVTYTFHPFVIGRGHRMMLLERLIDALEKRGAEFMTSEDAADAFLARRQEKG